MRKAVVIFILLLAFMIVLLEPARASTDYWVARAPIPVPFSVEAAATVNGQVYVFGVDNSGKPLSYCYNPTTNTWTARAPMPTTRTTFSLVDCNNKIYAIGGIIGYDTSKGITYSTNVNEIYDPTTNSWVTTSPMPTNRSQVQAVNAHGKIYVIGGRAEGQYSTVNTTEIYDPTTNSWSQGSPMPYPVVSAASAVIDNNIYVMGGQDEFSKPLNLAVTQIYNTATDTWSIGPPLPVATWQAVGAATTGTNAPKRVYVIGGLDASSDKPLATNQIYNPETNSWAIGAPFPTTHDYVTETLAAANLDDSIFVVGGIARANEGFYEITEQYIPTNYNRTVLPEQPITTPTTIPSNPATVPPNASTSPSTTVPELQLWIIPVFLLIVTISAALLTKQKPPTATRH